MSKRQLYTLRVRRISTKVGRTRVELPVHFRTAQGAEYFTCQFQVRFDSKGIAHPLTAAGVATSPRRPRPGLQTVHVMNAQFLPLSMKTEATLSVYAALGNHAVVRIPGRRCQA